MQKSVFEIRFRDPIHWKNKADRHFFASMFLHDRLKDQMKNFSTWSIQDDQEFLSLLDAFFILISLAFENLIKGLIISYEPDIRDVNTYKIKYHFNYNHNLIRMIERNFRPLIIDESKLFLRLQDYLQGLGRYPVPKPDNIDKKQFIGYKLNDYVLICSLYEEISDILNANWDKSKEAYFSFIKNFEE